MSGALGKLGQSKCGDAMLANATVGGGTSGQQWITPAYAGRIASPDKLAALLEGLDPSKRTIVSCGSGVSASGSYFALKAAGFTDLAVYDGSWMEWSHDRLPTVPKTPS